MTKIERKTISYTAKGVVLGNYWSGGQGSYPSERYFNNNLDEMITEIETDLKSGVLDGGMGFESLIGALMYIDTITDIVIDGKVFSNVETVTEVIGDLTEEQQDFLFDVTER